MKKKLVPSMECTRKNLGSENKSPLNIYPFSYHVTIKGKVGKDARVVNPRITAMVHSEQLP